VKGDVRQDVLPEIREKQGGTSGNLQ